MALSCTSHGPPKTDERPLGGSSRVVPLAGHARRGHGGCIRAHVAWSTRHNRGRPRFPPVQQGTEVQSDGVQGSCCSAVKRREAIAGLSALLAASGWSLPNDAQALPDFINSTAAGLIGTGFDLRAVLSDGQPRISSPGLSWSPSKRQKQLFYPAWMEGTWDVTAEFAGFYAPLGSRFVSSSTPGFTKASILAMADAGATPVSYQARYLYSKDEGGVVADRPFNITSCVDAFLNKKSSVRGVDYDPLTNPTRYRVVYATPRKDTREQAEDLRKAEVFINNRVVQTGQEAEGGQYFLSAEFQRQVVQAARQGAVNDFMVATKLRQRQDGSLEGLQRVAAFLQPQDPAYFDVGGQAVAVYDYSLTYRRSPT